jgi:enamine deaminase RidA (YjgF/YER057c/UK114 family)
MQKIFANLDQILQAAGIEHRQLAFVRIYLVDFERLIERVNKAYLECLGEGPLPARTIVGISNITRGALLEGEDGDAAVRPVTTQRTPPCPGGLAANVEPRTHMRPSGSCQSFSSTCSLPKARVIACSGTSGNASITCA